MPRCKLRSWRTRENGQPGITLLSCQSWVVKADWHNTSKTWRCRRRGKDFLVYLVRICHHWRYTAGKYELATSEQRQTPHSIRDIHERIKARNERMLAGNNENSNECIVSLEYFSNMPTIPSRFWWKPATLMQTLGWESQLKEWQHLLSMFSVFRRRWDGHQKRTHRSRMALVQENSRGSSVEIEAASDYRSRD